MESTALVFQSTTFDVIDQNGQPWLRSPQIADALGYSQTNRISDLYTRHADEFTADMTAVVKLPSEGGEQETRIFSPRGCYALGMFARTKVAKLFRVWVLDVLEGKASLPHLITVAQQGELATLIAERFPVGKDRPYAWSRFNNHFRVNSYKNLPADKYDEACSYIAQMPVKVLAIPAPEVRSEEIEQKMVRCMILANALASEIFRDLVQYGESEIKNSRFLTYFDGLTPHAHALKSDVYIASLAQLTEMIAEPNGILPSNAELANLAKACNDRLALRMGKAA